MDKSINEVFPEMNPTIDDTVELAVKINEGLSYELLNEILVKPLKQIEVERTQVEQFNPYAGATGSNAGGSKPKMKKRPKSDDDLPEGMHRVKRKGITMQQHGIVIKLPVMQLPPHLQDVIKIGTTIVFEVRNARPFELFKDSLIIPPHAVVGIYTANPMNIGMPEEEANVVVVK